jgi:hypothetical protein
MVRIVDDLIRTAVRKVMRPPSAADQRSRNNLFFTVNKSDPATNPLLTKSVVVVDDASNLLFRVPVIMDFVLGPRIPWTGRQRVGSLA